MEVREKNDCGQENKNVKFLKADERFCNFVDCGHFLHEVQLHCRFYIKSKSDKELHNSRRLNGF